jgi:hypothetical protein
MATLLDIINQNLATSGKTTLGTNTNAVTNSDYFYHMPPAGSVKLPLPQGYPTNLPYWMLTPTNQLKIYPTPFGRKLTPAEMATVLQALQLILNATLSPAPNVLTYVEPKNGWNFASAIDDALTKKEGDFLFISTIENDFLTAYGKSLADQSQKDTVAAIGNVIKGVVALVPIVGAVEKIASNAAASQSTTDLLNQIANLQAVKSAPPISNPVENAISNMTDQQKQMLLFAGIAIVIIIIVLLIK